MPIFDYNHFQDPLYIGDDPHSEVCIFCQNKLEKYSMKDYWDTDIKSIIELHELEKFEWEYQGMDKYSWELNTSITFSEVGLNFCNKCGWWRILKDITIPGKEWQFWQFFFGIAGILKTFDVSDIDNPVDEISKYLLAKYDARFIINPKLFEDVTGQVFKNLGYDVLVTGYSNDGGIDIVMEKGIQHIGVQVKRYKNRIKISQIRELTGALYLSDIPQGIFITTSDFQKGAYKLVQKSNEKGIPIRLINAKRFYEILKLTQRSKLDVMEFKNKLEVLKKVNLYNYNWENPMNSL